MNASKPFLSVCIIARDEEKFIGQCIESIESIADEIIVVDAFSQDNTVRIVSNYAATLYQRAWDNDFSAARNYAIDHAAGDWILFLDADESITHPEQLLGSIKAEDSPTTGGFYIERTDHYRHRDNQKISKYSVGTVRIFKNLPELRFRYKIHEQINSVILDHGLEIKILLGASISHDVQGSSDEQLDKKQQYYLQLLNQELKLNPGEPWLSYHKAKTLWYFKHYEEALSLFSELSNSVTAPLDIRASSTNQCAVLLFQQGQNKEALSTIDRSISMIPEQSMAYAIAYNIYYEGDEFTKAIESIRKVKTTLDRCSWHHIIPGDLYVPKDVQSYKVGCAYLALEEITLSKKQFENGIQFNNSNADNYYGLAIILTEENDLLNARLSIDACLRLNKSWKEAIALKQLLES